MLNKTSRSKTLLKKLAVLKDNKRVYQIGCTATLLNVHAQQKRAFNLVWALQRQELIVCGSSVGIIGGGIAGLSAAAAFLACGAIVRLYEQTNGLMHLQQGCLTRFLHPNLALWPESGFGYPFTHLPYMNWRASSAADVFEQIMRQWDSLAQIHQKSGRLTVITGAKVAKIEPNSKNVRLSFEIMPDKYSGLSKSEKHARLLEDMETEIKRVEPITKVANHSIVVIASGYGFEAPKFSNTPSYWRNDDFAQPIIGSKNRKRYLVSGAGDGGLIDTLRLSLRDFQHQRFIQEVMYDASMVNYARGLADDLAQASKETQDAIWTRLLEQTSDPEDYWRIALRKAFVKLIREDTLVVLNSPHIFPWHSSAQILHKLAIIALYQEKAIRYVPGRLTKVFTDHSSKELVALIEKPSNNSGAKPHFERIDTIVERHNSAPTLPELLGVNGQKIFTRLKKRWLDDEQEDASSRPPQDGYLADSFMPQHHETSYEIGIVLNQSSKPAQIVETFLNELKKPDRTRSWNIASPYKVDKHLSFQIENHTFHWQNSQQNLKCLILKTDRREYLERALQREPEYHFYKVYVSPSVKAFKIDSSKKLMGFTLFAQLVNEMFRQRKPFFEIQCLGCNDTPNGGMYLAHKLIRTPLALEIVGNRWPVTKMEGLGWAIATPWQVLFEHMRGNELLQWDNHPGWWLPECK